MNTKIGLVLVVSVLMLGNTGAEEITKLTLDEQGRTIVNDAPVSHYPNLKAVFLSMPPPIYDLRLRRSNVTGSGIFTVFTDEKGKVTDVKVRKSTGHRELDAQAIYGLRQWRAKPGAQRQLDVPITFMLPEKRGPSL
jgi:TonB family protein